MKKILLLHGSLDIGGAERMRLMLLRNIDNKRKYDIRVCCIGHKGPIGKEIERIGFPVDELGKDADSFSMDVTRSVSGYLKGNRPDILHSSLFNANFHARIAGFLCRIPHIITEEHGELNFYKGIRFLPRILTDFFLSNMTDFIICCSEGLKRDIIRREKLNRNKVLAIENCLDANMYTKGMERNAIRKRHGISDGELVFITTATLKTGKGHADLIRVLSSIKNMGYGFKCFFAGDGPLKETLYNKVCDLGLSDEVIFLGNVDNITDYLNASDVFMLPSFSEGFSIALMEAMLMGLASVVTSVGSSPELIRHGFNGILVMPGNVDELMKAMLFYFNNREQVKLFGDRSRNIMKERYSSIDDYVRRYYELWDRCANNKR